MVDDVQVNRVVLRAMLTGAAHTVSEARGGREALGLIHQHHYDMILLDIRMPDIDGLEVTTRLRAMPGWTSEVPIIGVSRRRHARNHPGLPGRGDGRRPAQTREIRRPSSDSNACIPTATPQPPPEGRRFAQHLASGVIDPGAGWA